MLPSGSQRPRTRGSTVWSIGSARVGFVQGAGSVVAVLAANTGLYLAGDWLSTTILASALVATFSFAVVLQTFFSYVAPPGKIRYANAPAKTVEFMTAMSGALFVFWIAGWVTKSAADFYCHPDVPWRLEIAVFGGFATALLLRMTSRTRLKPVLRIAIFVALFWIGPFYGFFLAPIFLAQKLAFVCDTQVATDVVLATGGMLL